MKNKTRIPTQKGNALLTALFIMTITAIAATAMVMRTHIQIQRTQWLFNADQIYLYAQGVSVWGKGMLQKNISNNRKLGNEDAIDHLPLHFEEHYQQAEVNGELTDLEGRFNINRLAAATENNISSLRALAHLLNVTYPRLSEQRAMDIATRIWQWMHPGDGQRVRLFRTVSQLREIPQVPLALYLKCEAFLSALPLDANKININTAPWEVLTSLGAGLTNSQAQEIVAIRERMHGFSNLAVFKHGGNLFPFHIPTEQLTVRSQYFCTKATIKMAEQQLILFDILKRTIKPDSVSVDTIYESRNCW